jgi:nucleoside transporter
MTHSPSELFPRIRVFGSIGWVVSGVCSLFTVSILKIDFDGTNVPFFYGAGISLVATLLNFTLPKTPPPAKGQKSSVIDALGLRAVSLMKDRNFAIFIIISFLTMIPFSMYWSYCSEFLLDRGFKYISITMNWGQFAEMFFVLTVPFIIRKTGLRMTMIIGLIVLAVRYLSFYTGGEAGQPWFYFIGILVHGIIYGYFFLGGQIYIDKKAPAELKAQAQGFIFLVTFGVGLLVGNFISRQIIEINSHSGVYNWNSIWGITTIMSIVLAVLMMIFFRKEKEIVR